MKQILRINRVERSGNQFQRLHGYQQTKIAKSWYAEIKVECRRQGLKPFPASSYPVRLTLVCYFPSEAKAYDWVNLWPTAKLLEDGLRKARIIREDTRREVAYGTMIPRVDRSTETAYSILTLNPNEP